MILFLVKHSRPDIANETRKRSKTNYSVNPAAFHKLLCVMMFVLDMKNLGFKLEPTGDVSKPWEIVCFSNSDYTGDSTCRMSISRFILYKLGILVSWQ